MICWREKAKVSAKAPYNQYGALAGEGATIAWGSPADVSAIPSGSFDVVYDNNGKDMAACQPAIDHFKVRLCMRGMQVHAVPMQVRLRTCPSPVLTHCSRTVLDTSVPCNAGQGGALCVCGLGGRIQGQRH